MALSTLRVMTTHEIPSEFEMQLELAVAARRHWASPEVQADSAKRHAAQTEAETHYRRLVRALDDWVDAAAHD